MKRFALSFFIIFSLTFAGMLAQAQEVSSTSTGTGYTVAQTYMVARNDYGTPHKKKKKKKSKKTAKKSKSGHKVAGKHKHRDVASKKKSKKKKKKKHSY